MKKEILYDNSMPTDGEFEMHARGFVKSAEQLSLLSLRLGTLVALVWLLSVHVRTLRVFRWEQKVTGGLLVTYCMILVGLALCAGTAQRDSPVLQAYLCGVGAVLFAVNAGALWRRWRSAAELTRVVAELLVTLGVKLRRQIVVKVSLSIVTAVALLIDLALTPMLTSRY